MCGICGIVDFKNNPIDPKLVGIMINTLSHRGPDGEGVFISQGFRVKGQGSIGKEQAVLGHRRLSIIDLKTGDQPIFNEDKSIAVVYNGEIYNFNELKEELLLTGFLNQNTIKILPLTIKAHEFVLNALKRGVKVYYLWSFEFIDKEVLKLNENEIKKLIDDLIENFNQLFNLTTEIEGFELRFTSIKMPTYFDIFDVRNIIFKLRDPLNPWQIFASMNVFDPTLAKNLREKFFDIWQFKSFRNFNINNYKVDMLVI